MNQEQRAALRKLAEEATPGPWSFYDDSNDGKTNRIEIVAIGKTVARIYHSVPEEDLPNAAHIAAANPSAILQLLDYIETLEKDAGRWRDLVSHQKFNNKPQVGYAINRAIERIDASMQGETE